LSSKLGAAEDTILTAIETISQTNSDLASSLRKEIKKLKLDEIRVDFSSAELMMHEEMALLRNSIDSHGLGTSGSANGSEKDLAKLKQLETENLNLRGLLKESKAEMLTLLKKPADGPTAHATGPPVEVQVEVESPALLQEVESLRKELQSVTQQLTEKTRELKDAQRQLTSLSNDTKSKESSSQELQNQISALHAQLDSAQMSNSSANEEVNQLKKQLKDLQAELEKERASATKKLTKAQAHATDLETKITEQQTKSEKEKEELMEAMALEVEVRASPPSLPPLPRPHLSSRRKLRRNTPPQRSPQQRRMPRS
jgi:predicted  nucleic acid-binding Zn-ribbon protein